MASVAAPYGFMPHENLVTGDTNFPVRKLAVSADIAAIAIGSPINVGASALTVVAATPTTTRNGNSPWGVVTNIEAVGPGGSNLGFYNYLPANATTAGYTNIVIHYTDSPFIVWKLQAGANTDAATAIGKNAAITYTAATSRGAQITLNAATIATSNTLAVKIIGFHPTSSATDTYPDYLVIWNQNVHAFCNILGV
jgi:hypothetical protein